MTERKKTTRKKTTARKKTTRKSTRKSSEPEADATTPAADEESTSTTTKKTTRRTKKRVAKSKTVKKTVKAATESDATEAPATTTKRKRRTRKKKTAPAVEPEADTSTTTKPGIKTVSPTAQVEQDENTIVIRFPSATDSPDETSAPQEEAVMDDNAETQAVPQVLEAPGEEDTGFVAEAPSFTDELDDVEEVIVNVPAKTVETDEADAQSEDAEKEEAPRRKRRRRGRRGRRGEGKPAETAATPEAEPQDDGEPTGDAEKAAEVTEEGEGEAPKTEKSSRRRRRRGRRGRKSEAPIEINGDEEADEKPAEKKPEADRAIAVDEHAKPTGNKEMVINVVPQEECRIAIMDEGKLQEIYLERSSAENYVGNIYKGVITNVEPSIQAAFVDFGQGKNGFLHISDLHPQYFPDGDGATENVGRKMPRRSRPPIQRCLRRRQELLVQITKEGIGTKGPTLTTYLSVPGRFLVMMPGMRQLGVSRKIEDDELRRKLRDQLQDLELPDEIGFIARTAAVDRTKRELQSDLNYLNRLWKAVEKRIKHQSAPCELYTESDLVIRTIRDVYTSDITRIVVDEPEVAERAAEFLSIFSPRSRDTVVCYTDNEPIFHRYGIEAELERLHSRHVPLKSGGSLVIDQTEALVAVDVNSGKFRTEDDAEATAYKINLEAADEIPRQLRLRDLGGVVICDLIDMRLDKHKREIERRLARNLKQHKERAKILRMSEFGIIEMTRQRQRASLTRSVYQDCRHCHGSGLVKTPESVALDVMRSIQLAITHDNIRWIEVNVSAEVAHMLQNRKRSQLVSLERKHGRSVVIRSRADFGLDQIQMQCSDQRGRVVPQP